MSNFTVAKLLRVDGRFAIQQLSSADARRRLHEARVRTASIGDGELARLLRAYLAHDIHVLEYRSGQVTRALAELRDALPLCEAAGPQAMDQYHEGMSKLEAIGLRPEAVLAHTSAVMAAETADTSRYNSAIFRFMSAEARLMLGQVDEARRLSEEAMALARSARQPGLAAECFWQLTGILLAEDAREAARALPADRRPGRSRRTRHACAGKTAGLRAKTGGTAARPDLNVHRAGRRGNARADHALRRPRTTLPAALRGRSPLQRLARIAGVPAGSRAARKRSISGSGSSRPRRTE